ncbi:hypothetical protein BDZ89DRAFT_731223 [Hymenopellis radicata]|nr:hypothetical protein BDZ89DRAFT_731223 [Hymenopellis radicata]
MAEELAPFLRQTLRITTTDSRIFLGAFAGTDKPLNIILVNAEEFRIVHTYPKPDNADLDAAEQDQESEMEREVRIAHETEMRVENMDGRYVGHISIPWRMIVKVEASLVEQYDSEED